jgi:two-component sensor histidine kinase
VISRSFADKSTVAEAKQAVLSRLHSLAQTHVMLIDKEWKGADIAEVVRTELSDPPPMNWSDSKYGFATEEDCNVEEETQTGRDRREVAAG